MEQTILAIQITTLVVLIIGGLFLKNYLPSYFSEKGKNLATREDVAAITEEIERTRVQYTVEIERLKANLTYNTGEQTRLREKQTEALLQFYQACRSVMQIESRILPHTTDNLTDLENQLELLNNACNEVMDSLIWLTLYMPHEHKVYQAACTLNDHTTSLHKSVTKYLRWIIATLKASEQPDQSSTHGMINELTIELETSMDSVHDSFATFMTVLNQHITSYERT